MPRKQRYAWEQERPPRPTRPTSSTDEDEPLPIGVPKGYTATVPIDFTGGGVTSATAAEGWASQGRGHGSLAERKARYYDGDDFKPALLAPTSIAELQRQMALAGLLTGSFRLGAWDEPSREAYRQLLGFANARGLDAENALGVYASGVAVETDAEGNIVNQQGPEVPPLVTRTTDPESLRQVFRQAVIETVGQGWDAERINMAVQAYNALEIERQTDAYEANLSGGNFVDIPAPEEFIMSRARAEDPEGAQTEEALGFVGDFFNMATGGGWSSDQ